MTVDSFIISLEGIALTPYNDEGDVSGADTIGVGHYLTDEEHRTGIIKIGKERVSWVTGISKENALALLSQDLAICSTCVLSNARVSLTENQLTALVSFVFNVGCGAFRKSTLLRLLNAGAYDQIPDQLRRWVKQDGAVVRGLKNRREKEVKMWEGKWK